MMRVEFKTTPVRTGSSAFKTVWPSYQWASSGVTQIIEDTMYIVQPQGIPDIQEHWHRSHCFKGDADTTRGCL